jgi:predicted transcriptional regulator
MFAPRLTLSWEMPTLNYMELRVSQDVEARLAAERGLNTDAIIQEAILKLLDYDEWFVREVDKGLAAADRGEFVEHDDVGALINRRYPG